MGVEENIKELECVKWSDLDQCIVCVVIQAKANG